MKVSLYTLALSLVWLSDSAAETVVIDYALDSAIAKIDPFTVPNPQGGADITIAPSITLETGDFRALFENADSSGIIDDGDATILGLEFAGEVSLALDSSIDFLGFPIAVEATISGPLGAQQQTDSNGILVGLSVYAETAPGTYDIAAGPLDCSDNVFGVFCSALEAALGTEFPLDGLDSSSALPFTGGIFSDLNPEFSGSNSSLSNQIDFSFPLTPELEFGVEIDTGWTETGRMILVPEPSAAVLLMAGLGLCLRRSR
ncbi:MAG: PEP-CTERM sorting domain-containing protein [Verrucomicrobiales bacterium]